MKRRAETFFLLGFLTALIVIFLAWTIAPAQAQTVNTWIDTGKGNWKSLAWDPVIALTDGDPLPDPADASLSYNIYVKNVNTQAVISIATGVTALSQEIILPKRARYLAGVEASLLYTGETTPSKSPISWSNDSAVCAGGQTFGLKFQTGPRDPKTLRVP